MKENLVNSWNIKYLLLPRSVQRVVVLLILGLFGLLQIAPQCATIQCLVMFILNQSVYSTSVGAYGPICNKSNDVIAGLSTLLTSSISLQQSSDTWLNKS